ncbi:DUF1223 domain-containing protein [Litoribrevibacter euphylliae]|uniref:DUF1223 domain-containing protein n=1 Tax=Litoribrevibacter euphylliae TaxID=1834034 RepID=A0ABV7HKL5_9GAMM
MRFGFFLSLLLLSLFAQGQTLTSSNHQTVMLELYTSQGCSSCPPAEKWISGFTEDDKLWDKLIPINFRVDYWDYLGWKDHYSNPLFSARQRRYQSLGHSRTVATPGFIVNGKGWNGWFYRRGITAESLSNAGILSIEFPDNLKKSDRITITFTNNSGTSDALMANLVVMGFGLEDYIKRGENRGKTFVQDFVVLGYDRQPLFLQSQSEEQTTDYTSTTTSTSISKGITSISLPDTSKHEAERYAVAVWVSEKNDPSPIQAVGGWIESGNL